MTNKNEIIIKEDEKEESINKEQLIKEVKAKAYVDLKSDIDEYINREAQKLVSKVDKRLIRDKNRKIIVRDIIILLLIILDFFFLFCLYKGIEIPVINRLIYKESKEENNSDNNNNNVSTNKQDEYNLNSYIDKYAFLVDDLALKKIDINNLFGNYNEKTLDNKVKLALAYGLLEKDTKEDVIKISEEDLKKAYERLFGTINSFKNENFTYANIDFLYSEHKKFYLGINDDYRENSLVYEFVNIEESSNDVVITLKPYYYHDNNIYDLKNTLIYSGINKIPVDDSKIAPYVLTFIKNGDAYIFSNIYLK